MDPAKMNRRGFVQAVLAIGVASGLGVIRAGVAATPDELLGALMAARGHPGKATIEQHDINEAVIVSFQRVDGVRQAVQVGHWTLARRTPEWIIVTSAGMLADWYDAFDAGKLDSRFNKA